MAHSGYTPETERRVELLLTELYEALEIRRPDDLFGSISIEARYQKGKPVGQVDVQIRYVMKREDSPRRTSSRQTDSSVEAISRRSQVRQ